VQDTTEQHHAADRHSEGRRSQLHLGDLTLSLDDFSKRILDPAISVLVANVEADALTMRKDVWQQANNTAAAITYANVLAGRRKLNDSPRPPATAPRCFRPTTRRAEQRLKGLFQDSSEIAKQYREGSMGRTGGFDFMESTHLSTQTRGDAASYVVNTSSGVTSGTATITTTGGTGTINAGEIFTVGTTAVGINSVHPETKADTGQLMQFVVTTTADCSRRMGGFADPDHLGADAELRHQLGGRVKAVTIVGTASTNYGQSMVYHEDAFTFATADLVMPSGVDFAKREVLDGISHADRAGLRYQQRPVPVSSRYPLRLQDASRRSSPAASPTSPANPRGRLKGRPRIFEGQDMATPEYLGTGNDDGVNHGRASSDKIGFYGLATPISQRAGAAQATSLVATASSTDVTTDLKGR
jgi:hypothetical protein